MSNLLADEILFTNLMSDLGVRLRTVPWDEAPRKSWRFSRFAVSNLLFSDRPLNVDKDYDPQLRRLVETELQKESFDLLVCDFVQMARNCIGLQIPKLLFQHNVEAEVLGRIADRSSLAMNRYLSLQAARMARFERLASRDFDRVVAVSDRDASHFENEYGLDNVDVIDTAVDFEYFKPSATTSERNGVVFVGSMDWAPNVDGILHFAKSIWPIIRSASSDACLTIVGRNPPASICRLNGLEGIRVTGTVDDVRPYLSGSAVAIVPLYSGGGTRLKIFESMAMKCPVVSTTLGAEGLGVIHGKHLSLIDGDESFAREVVRFLVDRHLGEERAESAYRFIRKRNDAETIAQQFESSCRKAIESWKSRLP